MLPPLISIIGTRSKVYYGTIYTMTCTANLTKNVDIPITITMTWRKQYYYYRSCSSSCNSCGCNNCKWCIYETWNLYKGPLSANEISPNLFQSNVIRSPVCKGDGGSYSCTAAVGAENFTDATAVAYFTYSVVGKFNLIFIIYFLYNRFT